MQSLDTKVRIKRQVLKILIGKQAEKVLNHILKGKSYEIIDTNTIIIEGIKHDL